MKLADKRGRSRWSSSNFTNPEEEAAVRLIRKRPLCSVCFSRCVERAHRQQDDLKDLNDEFCTAVELDFLARNWGRTRTSRRAGSTVLRHLIFIFSVALNSWIQGKRLHLHVLGFTALSTRETKLSSFSKRRDPTTCVDSVGSLLIRASSALSSETSQVTGSTGDLLESDENAFINRDVVGLLHLLFRLKPDDQPAIVLSDENGTATNLAEASKEMLLWRELTSPTGIQSLIQHYHESLDEEEKVPGILGTEMTSRHAQNTTQTTRVVNVVMPCSSILDGRKQDYKWSWDKRESATITAKARTLKALEVLASDIGDPPFGNVATMRRLLLSESDIQENDITGWLALAIRCILAMHQLEKMLRVVPDLPSQEIEVGNSSPLVLSTASTLGTTLNSLDYFQRTPKVMQAARLALQVYAPIAARIGLTKLKTSLEEAAFRIVYRRQYQAVSYLYQDGVRLVLNQFSGHLRDQIVSFLQSDPVFRHSVEHCYVYSRVKERSSLWRKMVRKKINNLSSATQYTDPSVDRNSSILNTGSLTRTSFGLSFSDTYDVVALRIIIKGRKLDSDETNETTQHREKALCYYVGHLLQSKWQTLGPDRVKDYIRHPKSNGYQSLHLTASSSVEGVEFPFEVQIRTEEMHEAAEYGVAAHWNYKLGDQLIPPVPSTGSGRGIIGLLPPASISSSKALLPKASEKSSHMGAERIVVSNEKKNVLVVFKETKPAFGSSSRPCEVALRTRGIKHN
jgi:Region found in RelA / SpoT proteins